jgi:4-alpha-glucanotransferase
MNERASGILLHITSLPSPYGIGDLGPAAHAFAERLAEARQKLWQILPLGPTSLGPATPRTAAIPPLRATRC